MAKLSKRRTYSARLTLIYLLVLAGPLSSQVSGTLPPKLRVQVLDSATGRPLLRTWTYQWRRGPDGRSLWVGSSRADMRNGVLELDRVSGSYAQVLCARSDGLYGGHELTTIDSTQLAAADRDSLTLRINSADCDRREVRTEYATWTGHYRSGIEESRLRLCGDSVRKIWVEYMPGFWNRPHVLWPPGNDRYYPEYFVQFRGALVGPFFFGHFGGSPYQLTVDSIFFVREPARGDCKRDPSGG